MAETGPVTIVVAGGGTAGWMTAATLARYLRRGFRIRLVESDAIGTVGVGEATIPQIIQFNQALGLDEDAFLAATQGTFKLGIEFVDWLRPGHRYMHAFGSLGRDVEGNAFQHYWLRARALGLAKPLDAYSLNEAAARAGRMHRGGPLTAQVIPPMPYAYHFDAGLYAAYLRRFAEAAGVERIEGRIVEVVRDGDSGDVAALRLDGERSVDGDLFVDCTGFRGLLIGEALGIGYDDWSRWLPCDRALAVPSERGELTPYTRSTARAAGWQWRIPLQHRTGNGHVYCSAFTSDDEAADALLGGLDTPALGDPRPISFTTGRRRQPWAHNVVALGLASGFLEPLESTSIHMIQSGIARLMKLLPSGGRVAAAQRAEYNRQADYEIERIRDFILLHYWANERDGPFWQACREVALPDTLAAKIDLWRAAGTIMREQDELFSEVGWLQVLAGQGVPAAAHHPFADQIEAPQLAEFMTLVEALFRREALAMPTHAAFIARHCAAAAA